VVEEVLRSLGGVARRASLLAVVPRSDLDRALAAGTVLRDARGRYSLPGLEADLREAARLGGTISHTSAALRHGWAVKAVPRLPHITVSRGRRIPARPPAIVHRAEVVGVVTDPETTLEQCCRRLPFDEALAIADSALREGFPAEVLRSLARDARGPGSRRLRRVAEHATPLAANPFESVLRAIALEVPGLRVRPQVRILGYRVDLADVGRHLVLEADSFAWHGDRAALDRDCGRYNDLVVDGWRVLRFSYEAVMRRPAQVRSTLESAVATELLNERGLRGGRAA